MQIKDLKHNPKNPRKISKKKLDALKKSVEKFGDLSGFIFNANTGRLVSGHQRSKILPPDATIKKEIKHDKPTKSGTIAEGYVLIGDERFKYREVQWSEKDEMEALLAANKHQGSWDSDLLRVAFADFPDMDLDITGFDASELQSMDIDLDFSFAEESDEQYIKNNPGPESEEKKEIIGEGLYVKGEEAKPDASEVKDIFDDVEEVDNSKNKEQIVIIRCENEDQKNKVKEKLRTDDLEKLFGVKIY